MPTRHRTIWLGLLPLAFLGFFLLYPLASILRLGLQPAALQEALSDRYYLEVLGFSMWLGLVSAVLTLMVGMPAAYVFSHYQFPGRGLLRAIATVPFVLPAVVVAAGMSALLGTNGLLGSLAHVLNTEPPVLTGTLAIVLFAHVFYNLGIVIRLVGGIWQSLNPRLNQAAAMLGMNVWQRLWRITLPLLAPGISAAALLVFLYCFGSFGIVLLLGGPRMATLEVVIYQQMAQQLNLALAASLALVQTIVTILVGWLASRVLGRSTGRSDLRVRPEALRQPRGWRAIALIAVVALLITLLAMPMPALAWRSLTLAAVPGAPAEWTLRYYALLGQLRRGGLLPVPPIQALFNSFGIATVTTMLAVPLGFLAARAARAPTLLARLLEGLATLPLGVSAVMLGLGYIVAYGPLGLLSSLWLVPLAHTLLAFPLVVRTLIPAVRGLEQRLHEAGRMLGLSPLQATLRIDLPLLIPALLSAAIFAFTTSLGDIGATLLLARPEFPTVPTAIARLLGQPGSANYGQALALATLMLLTSTSGFLVIERIRPVGVGEL